jgi:hypothetical protein
MSADFCEMKYLKNFSLVSLLYLNSLDVVTFVVPRGTLKLDNLHCRAKQSLLIFYLDR